MALSDSVICIDSDGDCEDSAVVISDSEEDVIFINEIHTRRAKSKVTADPSDCLDLSLPNLGLDCCDHGGTGLVEPPDFFSVDASHTDSCLDTTVSEQSVGDDTSECIDTPIIPACDNLVSERVPEPFIATTGAPPLGKVECPPQPADGCMQSDVSGTLTSQDLPTVLSFDSTIDPEPTNLNADNLPQVDLTSSPIGNLPDEFMTKRLDSTANCDAHGSSSVQRLTSGTLSNLSLSPQTADTKQSEVTDVAHLSTPKTYEESKSHQQNCKDRSKSCDYDPVLPDLSPLNTSAGSSQSSCDTSLLKGDLALSSSSGDSSDESDRRANHQSATSLNLSSSKQSSTSKLTPSSSSRPDASSNDLSSQDPDPLPYPVLHMLSDSESDSDSEGHVSSTTSEVHVSSPRPLGRTILPSTPMFDKLINSPKHTTGSFAGAGPASYANNESSSSADNFSGPSMGGSVFDSTSASLHSSNTATASGASSGVVAAADPAVGSTMPGCDSQSSNNAQADNLTERLRALYHSGHNTLTDADCVDDFLMGRNRQSSSNAQPHNLTDRLKSLYHSGRSSAFDCVDFRKRFPLRPKLIKARSWNRGVEPHSGATTCRPDNSGGLPSAHPVKNTHLQDKFILHKKRINSHVKRPRISLKLLRSGLSQVLSKSVPSLPVASSSSPVASTSSPSSVVPPKKRIFPFQDSLPDLSSSISLPKSAPIVSKQNPLESLPKAAPAVLEQTHLGNLPKSAPVVTKQTPLLLNLLDVNSTQPASDNGSGADVVSMAPCKKRPRIEIEQHEECGDCEKIMALREVLTCVCGHTCCKGCVEKKVTKLLARGGKGLPECSNVKCKQEVEQDKLREFLPRMVMEILAKKIQEETITDIKDWLRLEEVRQGRKDIERTMDLPVHWQPMDEYQDFFVVTLDSNSPEHKMVHDRFHKTMMKPRAVISCIKRVQNPNLWRFYAMRRHQMIKVSDPTKEIEQQLFHGTKKEHVEAISRDNFDWRLCGVHGTAFGMGSYFARDASYSHRYTDQFPSGGGQSYPFLRHLPPGKMPLMSSLGPPPNKFSALTCRIMTHPLPPGNPLYPSMPPMSFHFGTHNPSVVPVPSSSLNPNSLPVGSLPASGMLSGKDPLLVDTSTSGPPMRPKHTHVMFLAKVLTGRYAMGHSSYRKPPILDTNCKNSKSFDSCVNALHNPTIFVVFEKSQCYPEYIIEYTNSP